MRGRVSINIGAPRQRPDPLLTRVSSGSSYGALELLYDDIENVPVTDASSVSDWNTFFDLPTNGTPFSSVAIDGNTVKLYGGSGITLKSFLFGSDSRKQAERIISVIDKADCIILCSECVFLGYTEETHWSCTNLITVDLPVCESAGSGSFAGCISLTTINLPVCESAGSGSFAGCISLTTINLPVCKSVGDSCFYGCEALLTINLPSVNTAGINSFTACSQLITISLPSLILAGESCFADNLSLTTINLPSVRSVATACFATNPSLSTINLSSCENLGETIGDDMLFGEVSGCTITLTVPAALMICDEGDPDGDIVTLQANNTVTIVAV